MGKYSTYSRRSDQGSKKKEVHPVLRGVGFAMIVLIPLVSFAAASEILRLNALRNWVAIPSDLLVKKSDFIYPLVTYLKAPSTFYVMIFLTIVIAVALFAIYSLLSFIIYRFFGPPLYSPYDVPPQHYQKRRKF